MIYIIILKILNLSLPTYTSRFFSDFLTESSYELLPYSLGRSHNTLSPGSSLNPPTLFQMGLPRLNDPMLDINLDPTCTVRSSHPLYNIEYQVLFLLKAAPSEVDLLFG